MKKLVLLNLLIIMISAQTFLFSVELGDVDENNEVDIVDALLVAQYYVGLNPPALINLSVSDVNADGVTDILDALLIAQFYVGIISELPGNSSTSGPTQSPVEDFVLESVNYMSLNMIHTKQWIITSADNILIENLYYADDTKEVNSYYINDLQLSQLRDAIEGIQNYSYHNNSRWDCEIKTYHITYFSIEINVEITFCYSPPDEASTSPPVDAAISNFYNIVDTVINEVIWGN